MFEKTSCCACCSASHFAWVISHAVLVGISFFISAYLENWLFFFATLLIPAVVFGVAWYSQLIRASN